MSDYYPFNKPFRQDKHLDEVVRLRERVTKLEAVVSAAKDMRGFLQCYLNEWDMAGTPKENAIKAVEVFNAKLDGVK